MTNIITLPDDKLKYISHSINESRTIIINVESMSKESICPYCGTVSNKVHSRYMRKIQDLPIQGQKVRLCLNNKKYFCVNVNCKHKTFAEQFAFYDPKAVKSKRLQDEILRVSLMQSSVSASKYLCGSIADIGKSTICNMIKKTKKETE